jgi:nucleotide-binding universal stress UspA family protein
MSTCSQHLLDEVRSEVVEKTQVAAISRVTIGRVLEEILSAAKQSDLLVPGARGLNPLRDLLIGMTVDRVLQIYKRPMLVVKKPPKESYRRVLVPIDFSTHSVAALKMAMLIAPNAEVWIIHVHVAPFDGRLRSAGVLNDEMERYRVEARQQALIRIDTLMRKVEDP